MIVIAGPTASGKSRLAAAVAETFGGTVINADSMQVYRELKVLTARPTADDMARVPHRLFGVLSAAESCSVGRWRDLALAEIARARRAGRLPVIVGGTGLYLRVLMTGLTRLPPVPAAVRAAARRRLDRIGAPALHAELGRRDPVMAARLAPGDGQRVARAWEVLEATGRSLAEWLREPGPGAPPETAFLTLLMMPPRDALYAACDDRFDGMMRGGALEEARSFAALGLDPDLPAARAVGLRPLLRHIAGDITLDEAQLLGRRDTRRYAKRQMTWFRHQLAPDAVFTEKFSESIEPKIFPFISEFLLTQGG